MKRCFAPATPLDDSTATSFASESCSLSAGSCCNPSLSDSRFASKRPRSTPTEGEIAVTSALNALSVRERDRVFEEIHGVHRNATLETPQFVASKLSGLLRQLEKLKRQDKQAYDLAELMSPRYVRDPVFLLMFLRADEFNIDRTVKRLTEHFQIKLELFGPDLLVKDIAWNDLSETDRYVAQSCSQIQYPDLRDNAGRTVLSYTYQLRYVWYTVMGFITGNTHAQQNGIVGIGYMVGKDDEKGSMQDATRLVNAMPYRYAALHMCYDNPNLKPIISVIQIYMNYQTKIRFRAHFGSHTECQYALMSFGINLKTFPITPSGELRTDEYLAFLAQRQQREAEAEEAAKASSKILYPLSNDVLFGRGKSYNDFAGNVKMYEYIDRYKSRYQQSVSKDEKTVLSEMVLMMVKESGGRFLKRAKAEEDGWVAVSDTVARDKISNTFRTRLK